jgi:hypothetical protein
MGIIKERLNDRDGGVQINAVFIEVLEKENKEN